MDESRSRFRIAAAIVASLVVLFGAFTLGGWLSDDTGSVRELRSEIAGLQALLESYEAAGAEMEAEVAAAASTAGDLDTELATLQDENAALRAELDQLTRDMDDMNGDAGAQDAVLAEMEAEVAQLTLRVEALTSYFGEELEALATDAQRAANNRACSEAQGALEGGAEPSTATEIVAAIEAQYDGVVSVDIDPVVRELRRCGPDGPGATATTEASDATVDGADTTAGGTDTTADGAGTTAPETTATTG